MYNIICPLQLPVHFGEYKLQRCHHMKCKNRKICLLSFFW